MNNTMPEEEKLAIAARYVEKLRELVPQFASILAAMGNVSWALVVATDVPPARDDSTDYWAGYAGNITDPNGIYREDLLAKLAELHARRIAAASNRTWVN